MDQLSLEVGYAPELAPELAMRVDGGGGAEGVLGVGGRGLGGVVGGEILCLGSQKGVN